MGNKASFKGLAVLYDAPVILRLLGCSGKLLHEATLELHEALRELGCRTYYFRHTYDEVNESIEAILHCYENSFPMFRETQEAVTRGEIKISDIYAIKAELELRLAGGLGIVEHGANYGDRRADHFQIDEGEFKKRLQKRGRWGAIGSLAAQRDAISLALIMRLRNGKQVRDVSKSGFLFVTHNVSLAISARDYLRDDECLAEGSVWPILTVGQLSTIAWIVSEVFQDDKRISKELIANCYAAALPDHDFDQKLKEVLSKTDPEMAHALYQNAFVVQSVRQVALQQTGGYSALVRTLNTAELLSEASAVREAEIEAARVEERHIAAAALDRREAENIAKEKARRLEKAQSIGAVGARIVMGVLFLAAAVAIARDYGLLGDEQHAGNWIGKVFLWALGVYAAADLFGVLPSASVRRSLEKWMAGLVIYLQVRLI